MFNILLQVLDDGRITDSQGRTVDFKNTVIILTSNLGSDLILEDLEKSRANGSNELSDEARNAIDQLLKRQFRPEFLNRLDDIVYYKRPPLQAVHPVPCGNDDREGDHRRRPHGRGHPDRGCGWERTAGAALNPTIMNDAPGGMENVPYRPERFCLSCGVVGTAHLRPVSFRQPRHFRGDDEHRPPTP